MEDQVVVEKIEGGSGSDAEGVEAEIRVGGGNVDAGGVGNIQSASF